MDLKLRRGLPEDAKTCGAICCEAFKAIAEHHNFPPNLPTPDVAIELNLSKKAILEKGFSVHPFPFCFFVAEGRD